VKDWCSAIPAGIRIAVQVAPNARKTEVAGILEDVLKIRLQAQPIEGRANDALIRYLADILDVPRTAVLITHGHTSKRKIVEIKAGYLTVQGVKQVLIAAAAP
jgi:hypothetical protein